MIYAVTKSSDETQAFAAALADLMRPRDLVLLSGEMGAGKTTFVQGFGRALGIDESITSPTFVLVRSYSARLPLHHIDLYRLDRLQEVIDLGLMEMLDEGGVALIEWGDHAEPVLPRDFLEIRLVVDYDDESVRHIRLRGEGVAWMQRESSLGDAIAQWVVARPESEAS